MWLHRNTRDCSPVLGCDRVGVGGVVVVLIEGYIYCLLERAYLVVLFYKEWIKIELIEN